MSSVTDEIKARIDLVDLIGRSVRLRKSGSSFKGLCPFHQEKTPSFYVFPASHTWVCFGCQKKGTAFDWLMEREHLEFGEALRMLAQMAGVELPAQREPEQEEATRRLFDLLTRSQAFYAAALRGTTGAAARRYLAERGISEATIETFGLGYAPSGNALLRHLAEGGFSDEEAVSAGVASVGDDGHHFDFFRDRVLFPIRDQQGRTIAFGGRTIGDGTPKYLNSRDTLLFHKQETLFALDLARKPIAQDRTAVVVEGYVDAVMAHQHGHRNVVATLGTAVTERHLALLRRLADEIVLALDSDAAGQAATWRTLQVAEQSLQVGARPVLGPNRRRVQYVPDRAAQLKVLSIPGAKDPDELIRTDPAQWTRLVQAARPVMDFVLDQVGSRHDLTTARGKADAAAEVAELLGRIANPIEQAHYVQRAAELLKVDEQAVRKTLPRASARVRAASNSPADEGQPAVIHESVEGDALDEYALSLLLRSREPDLGSAARITAATGLEDLALPQSRALADSILAGDVADLRERVSPELVLYLERADRFATDVAGFSDDQLSREVDRVRLQLRRRSLLFRQSHVSTLLREAEDDDERRRWATELSELAHAVDAVEQELDATPAPVVRSAA